MDSITVHEITHGSWSLEHVYSRHRKYLYAIRIRFTLLQVPPPFRCRNPACATVGRAPLCPTATSAVAGAASQGREVDPLRTDQPPFRGTAGPPVAEAVPKSGCPTFRHSSFPGRSDDSETRAWWLRDSGRVHYPKNRFPCWNP